MRNWILYSFLVLLPFASVCQTIDIDPIIKAWQTNDLTQTKRSAPFFDVVDEEKDTARFKQTLQALKQYLNKHPDNRLEARILMYEVFGSMVFAWIDPKYLTMLERSMQIAHNLQDDQLMAEIYPLYAEIKGQNNHLLYNLKTIEIQRRIGFSHFTTVHNRFFIVSYALYHSRDYRQSIQYGLECLSFKDQDKEHWLKKIYIFQLDILGAAYKKLGKYDSSAFYYQRILDTLASDPFQDFMQPLWTGIARGNIGHCLALENNSSAGIPLMLEYVKSSKATGDLANVAIGDNYLGGTYFRQKDYPAALIKWKEAYQFADKKDPDDNLLETTKGIADIYKIQLHTDSSFYYADLYHQFADTVNRRLSERSLAAMNARIAFDQLEDYLDQSRSALHRSRTILQIIITGVILLLVILILLYNRYRLKNKYRLETIRRNEELAKQEVENAKKQIADFTDHIIDKNNIIDSMQRELRENKENQENNELIEKLSRYVLISEEEWEKFRRDFSRAYPQFFNRLSQRLPQVTPAEERLSALIYLKVNNYQMAKMLGIERDSVFRAKRRLRQRLELPAEQAVEEYLYNILNINP